MRNILLLILIIHPFYSVIQAQETTPCGTDEITEKMYQQHPELKSLDERLFARFRQQRDFTSIDTVLTIPVVFHILHLNGVENISDAQVYDQMEILNRDFRKLNADTIDVIPAFQTLIADGKIEFKLASIDPDGNCTNGIEHIYSHETWRGDIGSHIHQWPREKYLNIWVVKWIEFGAEGYSYLPTSVDSLQYASLDGIVLQHNYVGSIGTSTPSHSRILTHEVGHYLGLRHVWGTGPVDYDCGDDGIDDTPITKGFYGCPNLTFDVCTPGVEENFQNYMDYSSCAKMFTPNQASYMHYILNSEYSGRNNLSTLSNLIATGTNLTSPPLCPPVADFQVNYVIPLDCIQDSVKFFNRSWGAPIDTYSWSFPTGSPSVSNLPNPKVVFSSPGYHEAILTVSNNAGSDTKTVSQAVWISYSWADNYGPHSEDFEGETADDWLVYGDVENDEKWQLINNVGYNSNHCYRLNYNSINNPIPFYRDGFGGNYDYLVSPVFDLSNTTSIQISFDYSGASLATDDSQMSDYLKVYRIDQCGVFTGLLADISGADLFPGTYTASDFVPSNNQWNHFTFNFSPSAQKVRFAFEYYSSDYANNFYIDNFNVNGILGTNDISSGEFTMNLYPNPTSGSEDLFIEYVPYSDLIISITDINGKLIFNENYNLQASPTIQIKGDKLKLQEGVYLVTLSDERGSKTKKLIVFN